MQIPSGTSLTIFAAGNSTQLTFVKERRCCCYVGNLFSCIPPVTIATVHMYYDKLGFLSNYFCLFVFLLDLEIALFFHLMIQ